MDYRILRLSPCFLVNAPAAGAFISIAYVQVLPMSLPRRAMEQMGFAVCCLTCDAADVAGSERCRVCIESHARARERLTSGPASSKAERLAREFVTMLAAAPFVITDGGSIQEECARLGVPTLLWRDRTERPDGIGENVLVSRYEDVVVDDFLADPERWRRSRRLGDERPAAEVVDVLVEMSGDA
jgi:hypothetical protein